MGGSQYRIRRISPIVGAPPAISSLDLMLLFRLLDCMANNTLATLSIKQLKRVVLIRERIQALEKELNQMVGGQPSTAKPPALPRRRKLSAAVRARISAAMKARWARVRAGKAKK